MKATSGAMALLLGAIITTACQSTSSCGSMVSERTEATGARACWQYTADFGGAVLGTPVTACPTAKQLGICTMNGDTAGPCGLIYYTDNGLTADEARRYCLDAGGTWSP